MSSTHTSLNVHVVFATKGRAPMIEGSWIRDMHGYISGTIRGLNADSLAVGGVADHVHLLVGLRSNQDVSVLVREIKKASNHWAQLNHFQSFAWQGGYAAFSFSSKDLPPLGTMLPIRKSTTGRFTSADELRELLIEAGIEIDERYFE